MPLLQVGYVLRVGQPLDLVWLLALAGAYWGCPLSPHLRSRIVLIMHTSVWPVGCTCKGATKTAYFLRAQALSGDLKGQCVLVHDIPTYLLYNCVGLLFSAHISLSG